MPPLAAGVEFLEAPLAVFGVLLVAGALVSGIANRTFISLSAAFVLAGLALGEGGAELLEFDPTSGFVQGLAVVALILVLWSDGLHVDQEMLQEAWHLPLRKLVLAMPITAGADRGGDPRAHRSRLDRVVPRRRAAVAHRSGPVVRRRHEPARSTDHPALAQPRVRPQRRPGAAGGARLHGCRCRGGGLRLVGVRAPGRAGGRGVGARRGVRCLAADAGRARARRRDQQAPEGAVRARRGVHGVRRRHAAARGQRPDRGVRRRDRVRHLAARHRRVLRVPVGRTWSSS